ncbi:hypothetical protein [Microbispora rosea]|uniref:hypothetical protein n=1 Tax=Microbispora rosea TaxID=58117 RepID=UPI00341D1230
MIRRLLLAGAACAAGIVVMAPIAASAETAAPQHAAATAQAGDWGHGGWGHGGWGYRSGRPWHGGYWGSPLGYWSRPLGYWSTPVVTAPVILVDSLAGDCAAADYNATPCDG